MLPWRCILHRNSSVGNEISRKMKTGVSASARLLFAFLPDYECNRDLTSTIRFGSARLELDPSRKKRPGKVESEKSRANIA